MLQYLREHKYVAESRRISGAILMGEEKVFRFETCHAVKVVIRRITPEIEISEEPFLLDRFGKNIEKLRRRGEQERMLESARKKAEGFKDLTLWFSDRESAPPTETNHTLFLLPDLQRQDEEIAPLLSAHSELEALYELATAEIKGTVFSKIPRKDFDEPASRFSKAFVADPLDALRTMGAEVSGPRKITSLYRVRRVLPHQHDDVFTTFGYPVFIAEG